MNQFRRFTGRTNGLSISFESHMLGSAIEYDAEAGGLLMRDPWSVLLSVIGALALNLVLAVNHKSGRYMGT